MHHVRLLHTAARILPRSILSPHCLALLARVRPLRARCYTTSPDPPRALPPASLDPLDTLPDVSSLSWPTAHIDDVLFDAHLPALYAAGWHVAYADSAALSKNFVVHDWKSAVQLAMDIGALATEEKHHPVITVAPGDPPTLTVRLTTHSCQRTLLGALPRVQNDGTGAREPAVDPIITVDAATNAIVDTPSDTPASFLVAPGLTARDLRLAWRIDRLHAASLPALNALPPHLAPPAAAHAHPPTLTELLRREFFRARQHAPPSAFDPASAPARTQGGLVCLLCTGGHHLRDCPDLYHARAPTPCPYCAGDHWGPACPQSPERRNSERMRSAEEQSKVRSAEEQRKVRRPHRQDRPRASVEQKRGGAEERNGRGADGATGRGMVQDALPAVEIDGLGGTHLPELSKRTRADLDMQRDSRLYRQLGKTR